MDISILGNCQIDPLALCLQMMAPEIEVRFKHITLDSLDFSSKEMKLLHESDAILSIERKLIEFEGSNVISHFSPDNFMEVPSILFDGFHPDLVYAKRNDKWLKNGLLGDWNSGLLIYLFENNYKSDDFVSLINNAEINEILGYTSRWDAACRFLENEFRERDFNFTKWMQIVRRNGNFMWGLNHPKLFAVCALAEQILEKLAVKPTRSMDEALNLMLDPLSHVVWPVHTPIANLFAVTAINSVRQADQVVDLQTFADLCFLEWEKGEANAKIELIGSRVDYKILDGKLGL